MNKTLFLLLNCIVACTTLSAMENQLAKPAKVASLVRASDRGDIEKVVALLATGADVNQKDAFGNTALHVAWTLKMVTFLLDHGADINKPNNLGCTPIYQAVFNDIPDDRPREDRHKIVKFLIEQGALITDYMQPTQQPQGVETLSASLTKAEFRRDPAQFIIEKREELRLQKRPLDASYFLALEGVSLIEMAQLTGNLQTLGLLHFCMKLEAERLALCAAKHLRLGAQSPVALLDLHTIATILSHIRPAELINDPASAKYMTLTNPQQPKKSNQYKTCLVC